MNTTFDGRGDPEWVNTVPTGQYLSSYVLFAEPGYGDTNLVVVRSRSEETGAFADVILDCAGPLGGWKAVGAYEFARVDLIADGQDVGACAAGRRRLSSSLPFGVTLWAWGSDDTDPPTGWVSYAYAPGAARKLNDVSLPWNPPVE